MILPRPFPQRHVCCRLLYERLWLFAHFFSSNFTVLRESDVITRCSTMKVAGTISVPDLPFFTWTITCNIDLNDDFSNTIGSYV